MGNILLTEVGMETANVDPKFRDSVVNDFISMHCEAESLGDRFYMTTNDQAHSYSYGEYYPAFVNLSWEEFRNVDSLRGISFNTFNRMVSDFQGFRLYSVNSESDFNKETIEPRGHGGLCYMGCPSDFICSLERLRIWHKNYFLIHPEDISWSEKSPFLPNLDAITRIIEHEVCRFLRMKYEDEFGEGCSEVKVCQSILNKIFSDAFYHVDNNVNSAIKSNAITLLFHHEVMKSMNRGDLQGYCMEVGGRICEENYYHYEPELSAKEQMLCGAQRHIYSVIKNHQKQYISFDFHKGMFEFHDGHGAHLGEYLFDGTLNAGPQVDHNLRALA